MGEVSFGKRVFSRVVRVSGSVAEAYGRLVGLLRGRCAGAGEPQYHVLAAVGHAAAETTAAIVLHDDREAAVAIVSWGVDSLTVVTAARARLVALPLPPFLPLPDFTEAETFVCPQQPAR